MIFRKNTPEEQPREAVTPQQQEFSEEMAEVPAMQPPAGGVSVLTPDVVMEGNLVTSGELMVDGAVHGTVQAARCTIGVDGVVQGYVVAEEVLVQGRVIGPICGVRVHIVSGGQVEGDVINTSLVVEDGAYLDGQIRRSEDPLGEWQQMWYGEEEAAREHEEHGGEEALALHAGAEAEEETAAAHPAPAAGESAAMPTELSGELPEEMTEAMEAAEATAEESASSGDMPGYLQPRKENGGEEEAGEDGALASGEKEKSPDTA